LTPQVTAVSPFPRALAALSKGLSAKQSVGLPSHQHWLLGTLEEAIQ
jgi:hypothetical protein